MGSQNKPLQTDAAEPALATAAPSGGEFVNTGNYWIVANAIHDAEVSFDAVSSRRAPNVA